MCGDQLNITKVEVDSHSFRNILYFIVQILLNTKISAITLIRLIYYLLKCKYINDIYNILMS